MIEDNVIFIQYLILSIVEIGIFVAYIKTTFGTRFYQDPARRFFVILRELGLCMARFLSFITIANLFLNDKFESLYVFFGLKLNIILFGVFELIFEEFRVLFLLYNLVILLQMVFVVYNYDKIIRVALWKYYKIIGTNPFLQSAYNVSNNLI